MTSKSLQNLYFSKDQEDLLGGGLWLLTDDDSLNEEMRLEDDSSTLPHHGSIIG